MHNKVRNGLNILLCGIGLFAGIAFGADWRLSKGLAISTTYTDNAELTNTNRESELIAEVTPHIALQREGARVTANLVAAVQYLNYLDEGDDSFNPRLQANTTTELIDNFAFFDANATATQNAIDPFARTGDTLNRSDNVTKTYSFDLSPYVRSRFRGFADLEARYTFSRVINSDQGVSNSDGHAALLSLISGPDFGRLSWGLTGEAEKIDDEDESDTEFKSIIASAGYAISQYWVLSASLGREWNEFSSIRSDVDGSVWDVGVRWIPNSRTSLEVRYGERFFGSTPAIEFFHRSRHSVLQASWSRDTTNSRTILREQQVFQVEDPFGQPIVDPVTGGPFLVSSDLTPLDDEVFVDERFRISYTLARRLTTLTLDGGLSKQERQNSQGEGKIISAGILLARRLSGDMTADMQLSWDRSEDEGDSGTIDREADTWTSQFGLTRRLGPRTDAQLAYGYSKRDSNQANDDYQENRVSLSLNIQL